MLNEDIICNKIIIYSPCDQRLNNYAQNMKFTSLDFVFLAMIFVEILNLNCGNNCKL